MVDLNKGRKSPLGEIESYEVDIQEVNLVLFKYPQLFVSRYYLDPFLDVVLLVPEDVAYPSCDEVSVSDVQVVRLAQIDFLYYL